MRHEDIKELLARIAATQLGDRGELFQYISDRTEIGGAARKRLLELNRELHASGRGSKDYTDELRWNICERILLEQSNAEIAAACKIPRGSVSAFRAHLTRGSYPEFTGPFTPNPFKKAA